MTKWRLLSILFLWAFAGGLPAKQIPTKEKKLVYDFSGVLSTNQIKSLEQKLVQFSDSSSNQIAVVLDPSLEGEDAFDYSLRIAEAWGIGSGEKNNGVLLYAAMQDREVRIQVGYGLEGAIPDALAKRIIERHIVPNFKQSRYYEGVNEAVDALMAASRGEYEAELTGAEKRDKYMPLVLLLVVIAFLVGGFFFGRNNKRGGGKGGGFRGGGPIFWGTTLGGGGFSGGGGFGGGGGGFGGFGGGSFGGGGAGGSW